MKKSVFKPEHIAAILRQHELGTPVTEIIRKFGIAEQTFYRWKKQYGGLTANQVVELKQLQDENTKLKRLVADLSLDKIMLQDALSRTWDGPRSSGK